MSASPKAMQVMIFYAVTDGVSLEPHHQCRRSSILTSLQVSLQTLGALTVKRTGHSTPPKRASKSSPDKSVSVTRGTKDGSRHSAKKCLTHPPAGKILRRPLAPPRDNPLTSTIQISFLEPAAHGTEDKIVAVPSEFCVTILSKKLWSVSRLHAAREKKSGTREEGRVWATAVVRVVGMSCLSSKNPGAQTTRAGVSGPREGRHACRLSVHGKKNILVYIYIKAPHFGFICFVYTRR